MGLRAPVLVGGALAGGLAYADEPVTIEPLAGGGYAVEFVASGTILYARDNSTILQAHASTAGITLQDKTGDIRVSIDENGIEVESIATGGTKVGTNGLKTEWITMLVGGRDETLTVSRPDSCDDGALLTIDGVNGEIRVDDCVSGSQVILTPNGIKADSVDMPVASDYFFVAPPRNLVVSPAHIRVRDLDADQIVFVGESNGTRIDGLHASEAFFEGAHHGVALGGGIIDYLQVDGILTGTALPGTTIGQYVGPSSFQATPPLVKFPGGGGTPGR